MTRRWIITDGFGHIQKVNGAGVVGLQPYLTPGHRFDYASFCPLATPSMQGSYHVVRSTGETFNVRMAPLTLALPHALNEPARG